VRRRGVSFKAYNHTYTKEGKRGKGVKGSSKVLAVFV
jgi:hypothetical protein